MVNFNTGKETLRAVVFQSQVWKSAGNVTWRATCASAISRSVAPAFKGVHSGTASRNQPSIFSQRAAMSSTALGAVGVAPAADRSSVIRTSRLLAARSIRGLSQYRRGMFSSQLRLQPRGTVAFGFAPAARSAHDFQSILPHGSQQRRLSFLRAVVRIGPEPDQHHR